MASTYFAYNGPAVTTAAPVKVTTGTAIKTMLQVSTSASEKLTVIEWGVSFDGSAAAVPIQCELIDTAAIAATVTAFGAADICKYSDPNTPASLITLGTGASGYTASAEGTIVASRQLDLQLVAPTGGFVHQFPLGREPQLAVSRNLRIRVTAPVAVSCYCYLVWEE